uniref:Major facilitator superfamily (MFS) profile domain-containing protein n=1 Tax=Timema monikensis TaxID=170555 RepID=A0A7R9HM86_9NEOP|nr:unnamed protein product [Timema monikensis]
MDDPQLGVSTQTLVSSKGEFQSAKRLPQYLAAISVTIGAFALGNVLAWTSPTADELSQTTNNNLTSTLMTQSEWSWVGSLMNIGAALVVLPVGYLIDRIGRKFTMLGLVFPFTAGWFLMVWAKQTVPLYYVGRIITGMMGGAFSLTAPVYVSEIAESDIRGTLGTYFQLMVTVGILFVYVLGSQVNAFALTLVCGIVPLVFGVVFFFMPETPLYYIQTGRIDRARDSLQYFRGKSYNVEPELQVIENVVDTSRAQKLSLRESFNTTAAKKALLVSLGLMVFQQLSGVNAVIFYTSNIFTEAGSDIKPAIATIIVGVIQVIATFISSLCIDKLGRRILLIASDAVMTICSAVLGVFFYLKHNGNDVSNIGWLPLVSVCLFIVMFSFGFGPIPWLMVGELFPNQIKGTASSIACLLNWFLSFLVTKFFSDMVTAFGIYTTFWIFSAISCLGTIFVFFIVPETKGKSLEEIQKELGGESPNNAPAGLVFEAPEKF